MASIELAPARVEGALRADPRMIAVMIECSTATRAFIGPRRAFSRLYRACG
ncbi:hypothetical protein [Streptomyces bluensis]|uniref:Uncharacterized protein n=1 Tax=Streptomyces bluensis TaxID=33897 RepID=A0ABW6UFQ9_9ACTN